MSLYKNWEQSIEKATPANAQNMLEEYYLKEKDINSYRNVISKLNLRK